MSITNAIKHLHPNARPFIDYEIADSQDGRGPQIIVWNLPGNPPAPAELEALAAEYDTAETERRQARQATRARILALLQSATGKSVIPGDPNAVTAAERQALAIAQLYMLGIVNGRAEVRDPAIWFKSIDD